MADERTAAVVGEHAGTRPFFSLLIAAYNSEATLGETLDSVVAQTEGGWEAIVVDDGSADRTFEIASEYAESDPRIRVIRERDVGAALSRNAAAAVSEGIWLCALDGDDMLVPDALAHQRTFMAEHPGYHIYSWAAWKLFPDGAQVPFDDSEEYRSVVSFEISDLIDHNRILANTVVDAEVFRAVDGYRNYMLEDYDLWLRVLHAGARHIHNPELLAIYRMRAASKSTLSSRMMAGTAEVLEAFAATPDLDAAHAASASERAQYWRAWAARVELEECLVAHEYGRARSLIDSARSTFPAGTKAALGLILLRLAPRVYVRYKSMRGAPASPTAE